MLAKYYAIPLPITLVALAVLIVVVILAGGGRKK